MKYVKFFFALLVCSLLDHLSLAGDKIPGITSGVSENGYDREKFCEEGAKKRIDRLNEMTKSDLDKIEELKKNINELEAKKKIISDMKNIRADYLNSIESIATEKDIAFAVTSSKKKTIDKFKQLLKTNLAMNAISLLMKENKIDSNNAPTIEILCKETEENKLNLSLNICRRYGTTNVIMKKYWSTEIKSINDTLLNFSKAMTQITDVNKKSVIVDVKEILNSVPTALDPDAVLETLTKKSETFLSLLENSSSREELAKCLNNADNSCIHLLSDPNKKDFLKDLLGKESSDVRDDLADKLSIVKNQITKDNGENLTSLLTFYNDPLKEVEESNRDILNNKLDEVEAYSKKLFKKLNPSADSSVTPNGFAPLGFTNIEYEAFVKECRISKEKTGDEFKKQVKICDNIVQSLADKADTVKNNLTAQTDALKEQLDKVLNHNPELERKEKLKQFVIQRYIRGCPNAGINELVSNLAYLKCDFATDAGNPADKVASLSQDFSRILGRLQSGNAVSNTKGELGLFSKDELKVYSSYCQNMSASQDSDTNEVCQKVRQYNSEIQNQREAKDWEEFNNKYWVEYNPRSKAGYDVYEKKSNSRIFAEGLSQSVSKIFPVWLGNMQLSNQIDIMTNQALYQKQLNYMYSASSPWSNFPYFQGSYFPNSSFNLSNPFLSNNGFNFSK